MALESPTLLYATLAYSAVQFPQSSSASRRTLAAKMAARSLQSFQVEFGRQDLKTNLSLLAGSMMLFLADVVAGNTMALSWRVHIEGAKALLTHIKDQLRHRQPDSFTTYMPFFDRWYLSIESLSSLTTKGLATGPLPLLDISETVLNGDVCDDQFGYFSKLALVFREIGVAARQRSQDPETQDFSSGSDIFTPDILDIKADQLQSAVYEMLDKVRHEQLTFYPGVQERLTAQDIQDFRHTCEAFLHVAIIHIERRVRSFPSSPESLSEAFQGMIEHVQHLVEKHPPYMSSPASAITPVLFIAGCEAVGPDRDVVRNLLEAFNPEGKALSAARVKEALESFWAVSSTGGLPAALRYQGQSGELFNVIKILRWPLTHSSYSHYLPGLFPLVI